MPEETTATMPEAAAPETADQRPVLRRKNVVDQKSFALETAAFEPDGQVGVFEGYASVFNVMDLQNDVVLPGAFTKTVQENGGVFPLLDQHNPDWEIGLISAHEDTYGLKIRGEFYVDPAGDPTNEVRQAREVYVKMKRRQEAGKPLQFSIGYRAINPRIEGDKRFLPEVALGEVSTVTFPAAPMAVTTGVKSDGVHNGSEAKEGRTLSAATKQKLTTAIEALSAAADALQGLLGDTGKSAAPGDEGTPAPAATSTPEGSSQPGSKGADPAPATGPLVDLLKEMSGAASAAPQSDAADPAAALAVSARVQELLKSMRAEGTKEDDHAG